MAFTSYSTIVHLLAVLKQIQCCMKVCSLVYKYQKVCSTGRPCHAALLFKCLEVGDSPLHILKDLQKLGDWMTKVDLRDAYFMVPIHKDKAFLRS